MTAIRTPGRVNNNTTLIDCRYEGIARVGGVFLVEVGKTGLIDCGFKAGASRNANVNLINPAFDDQHGVKIASSRLGKTQEGRKI